MITSRTLLITMAILFSTLSFSALAINCQRSASPLESTICNDRDLRWLDHTFNIVYQKALEHNDVKSTYQKRQDWQKHIAECISEACIERAYYQGISLFSDVDRNFDWNGIWWNDSAPNGNGGKLEIILQTDWGFKLDSRLWSGINVGSFSGDARRMYGLALIDSLSGSGNCKVLLTPLKSGVIHIDSNGDAGCNMSMPQGIFIDGKYVRSKDDPRPPATLLSVGIFHDQQTDQHFRDLVGEFYGDFVKVANIYRYTSDLDNIGANVLTMWVNGNATHQAAIIMYKPQGTMWAALVNTDSSGKRHFRYFHNDTTASKNVPRTILAWEQHFTVE